MAFLKGFHLTLSSHLSGQNDEGRKLGERAWRVYMQDKLNLGDLTQAELEASDNADGTPPVKMKPVPRLYQAVEAMEIFFARAEPPEISVRSKNVKVVLYGFADTSGRGCGSTVLGLNGVALGERTTRRRVPTGRNSKMSSKQLSASQLKAR
jgi:hypothetical protein